MAALTAPIRSLAFATDLDVLADQSEITDHGDHVTVVTPANVHYHWGNFLLWRDVPTAGAREAWETAFKREVGERRHRLFAWDAVDGELGAAQGEFVDVGYELEHISALVARADELRSHDRTNADMLVRRLDPRADGPDAAAWLQVVELQMGNREPGYGEAEHRAFLEASALQRQEMYRAGRAGGWYVAELSDGTVVATCGIVVTDGRARYQAVDTHLDHRRHGHASRLVYDVGREAIEQHAAEQLVIVADVDYHAKELYETLGFVERHRSTAAIWHPGTPRASEHPTLGYLARAAG